MSDEIRNEEWTSEFEKTLQEIKKTGSFDIQPCTSLTNIEDNPKFKKIELTSGQKAQMQAIINNLPRMANIAAVSGVAKYAATNDLYIMTLPIGMRKFLMTYKDGRGFGNTLFGVNKEFAMQVGLNRVDIAPVLAAQNVAMVTLTAMSVVTQQYFLAQINNDLDRIKLGVDKILEFLYGDKKAELMSEVSFVKYALNNYSAIMDNQTQRIATIAGLQHARKVAMKDCEFYVSDLETTVNEKNDISAITMKAMQIEESLTLSLQLCVMSTILEVNYSQNYDEDYLKYIEDDISLYIDKTEKFIIGIYNKLQLMIENAKNSKWKGVDKEELQDGVKAVLDRYKNGGESELTRTLRSGLHTADKASTYYISSKGEIYIKTA